MIKKESNVGINYEKLGTSIRYYAIGSLILAVIVFLSSLLFTFGGGAMLFGPNPIQAFTSYINMLKGYSIVVMILSFIEFSLFGNFLKELFNSSGKNDRSGSTLRVAFKFFMIGVILQVILAIISIIVEFKGFDALLDLISDFYSIGLEDIIALENIILGWQSIVNAFSFIPLLLLLGGYLNFKKLGDELSRQDSFNMNVLKIKKGLELLSYAAIIAIINALLAYILAEILIGLIALIYLIVLYVGLFKTGSGMIEFQPQIFTQPVSNGRRPEEFGTFNSPQPSDITKMKSEKICPSCGSTQSSGIFCAKCGATLE